MILNCIVIYRLNILVTKHIEVRNVYDGVILDYINGTARAQHTILLKRVDSFIHGVQ